VDLHFPGDKTPENPSQSSSGHSLHIPFKGLHPPLFLFTPNKSSVLEMQAFLLSEAIKGFGENVAQKKVLNKVKFLQFLAFYKQGF